MRKIRNHGVSTNDPALMFARGLESLIADHLHNPSQRDRQQLRQMRRVAGKHGSRGNLFGFLLKQFANF